MKTWNRYIGSFAGLMGVLSMISPCAQATTKVPWTPYQTLPKPPERVIYLTFDDGPSLVYTPQILTILRREHVHATFFVLGSRVHSFPSIAKHIVEDGNEVGNHGYQHDYPSRKSATWVVSDVERTDGAIRKVIGTVPVYYRPPGGMITPLEVTTIQSLGHPLAMWTVDTRDWAATNPEQIINEVLRHARPGAIILMHDGVSQSRYTVKALPIVIDQLRNRGYSFATLPTGRKRLSNTPGSHK